MRHLYPLPRWVAPVCLLLLLLATSAFADDQMPDPNDWLAWLLWLSRIGVPGG